MAGPGRLPILHPDDVTAAAAFCRTQAAAVRLRAIAARKGFPLPPAERVTFSASVVKSGDDFPAGHVRYAGKIFEVGDYPDKKFSMTEDELASAASDFSSPVHADLEHTPTILDKQLGRLNRVWTSKDRRELYGEMTVPRWLDNMAAKSGRKLSAAFDRKTKRIVGISWVLNPRVSDAALRAAFSAAKFEGTTMPDDLTADPTAPAADPTAADPSADTGTLHGADLFAKINDMLDSALSDAEGNSMYSPDYIDSLKEMQKIASQNSAKADEGAGDGGDKADMSKNKGKKVGMSDGKSLNLDDPRNPLLAKDTSKAQTAIAAMCDDDKAAMSAKFSAYDKEILTLKQGKWEAEGKVWASETIRGGFASPAERDGMIADFCQSMADDDAAGNQAVVTFGAEKVTRNECLRRRYAARPKMAVTGELLSGTANFNQTGGAAGAEAISPERFNALLAKTPVGRSVMAKTNGTGKN
jgi:hypothetical protein